MLQLISAEHEETGQIQHSNDSRRKGGIDSMEDITMIIFLLSFHFILYHSV